MEITQILKLKSYLQYYHMRSRHAIGRHRVTWRPLRALLLGVREARDIQCEPCDWPAYRVSCDGSPASGRHSVTWHGASALPFAERPATRWTSRSPFTMPDSTVVRRLTAELWLPPRLIFVKLLHLVAPLLLSPALGLHPALGLPTTTRCTGWARKHVPLPVPVYWLVSIT